jgi:hypothetical protein
MNRIIRTTVIAAAAIVVSSPAIGFAGQPAPAPQHRHDHTDQEARQHATAPPSLVAEHEAIHADLVRATQEPGSVGAAAKALAAIMHPHFAKEEELAMPPLGMLQEVARGAFPPAKAKGPGKRPPVLDITDRLEAELPAMLEEHKAIVAALEKLAAAAREENKLEWVAFAERLGHHAKMEEEVLYPTAILVGRYIKAVYGIK